MTAVATVYRTLDDLDDIRGDAQRALRRIPAPSASSSAAACWAWRRPTRCASSACARTSSSTTRDSCRNRSTRPVANILPAWWASSVSTCRWGRHVEHRGARRRCPPGHAWRGHRRRRRPFVFAAGVRPRDELGRLAELELAERGGIPDRPRLCDVGSRDLRDRRGRGHRRRLLRPCRTGLCDRRGGRRPPAGRRRGVPGADLSTKLKLLGVDVASFGDAHGRTPGALNVVVSDPINGTYSKLVLRRRLDPAGRHPRR